jgi:chromosome partitioning protein
MNLTSTLGAGGEFNIFDVLYAGGTGTLGQAAERSAWSGIDLVAGTEDLARIDTENLVGAELRLKAAMEGSSELEAYDHVLVDLPPAVGRLTLNGLIAADDVLVVTEPERYAVDGVQAFLAAVDKVKGASYLNPALRFAGIIVNKVSAPLTAEHKFQIEQLTEAFGDDLLHPFLPARTAMKDSQSAGVPLPKIPSRGAAILTERFVEHARRINGGN